MLLELTALMKRSHEDMPNGKEPKKSTSRGRTWLR
jgi:hypothetical protein